MGEWMELMYPLTATPHFSVGKLYVLLHGIDVFFQDIRSLGIVNEIPVQLLEGRFEFLTARLCLK